jgi:hypothetical protein
MQKIIDILTGKALRGIIKKAEKSPTSKCKKSGAARKIFVNGWWMVLNFWVFVF